MGVLDKHLSPLEGVEEMQNMWTGEGDAYAGTLSEGAKKKPECGGE